MYMYKYMYMYVYANVYDKYVYMCVSVLEPMCICSV